MCKIDKMMFLPFSWVDPSGGLRPVVDEVYLAIIVSPDVPSFGQRLTAAGIVDSCVHRSCRGRSWSCHVRHSVGGGTVLSGGGVVDILRLVGGALPRLVLRHRLGTQRPLGCSHGHNRFTGPQNFFFSSDNFTTTGAHHMRFFCLGLND